MIGIYNIYIYNVIHGYNSIISYTATPCKFYKRPSSKTIAEHFLFKSPICKKFCIAMHNFQGSHDGELYNMPFIQEYFLQLITIF